MRRETKSSGRRSETDPAKVLDRPQRFQERHEFVKSKLYMHLLSIAQAQLGKATREMICLLLWGMARLRDRSLKLRTSATVKVWPS